MGNFAGVDRATDKHDVLESNILCGRVKDI
jgi:hypothetical protein